MVRPKVSHLGLRKSLMDAEIKVAIGVDLGGTNIRVAEVDAEGHLFHQVRRSTPAGRGEEAVIDRMKGAIGRLLEAADRDKGQILGIGIGSPGLVDPGRGVVHIPPNFPGWDSVPLGKKVEDAFGLPTRVTNDVNAMALAESRLGAGKGYNSLICVTLGTGVGGAFVLDGKVYTGFTGSAGEIGHITVEPNGPRCRCGNFGCLERLVGAEYIVERAVRRLRGPGADSILPKMANGRLGSLTPKLITEAARQGDGAAKEVLWEVGEYLGIVFSGLVNFLNPEAIIVGGGIAEAGALIFDPIVEVVRKRAMPIPAQAVHIIPAQLGERAGVVGAALLVFNG